MNSAPIYTGPLSPARTFPRAALAPMAYDPDSTDRLIPEKTETATVLPCVIFAESPAEAMP